MGGMPEGQHEKMCDAKAELEGQLSTEMWKIYVNRNVEKYLSSEMCNNLSTEIGKKLVLII